MSPDAFHQKEMKLGGIQTPTSHSIKRPTCQGRLGRILYLDVGDPPFRKL